MLPPPPDLPRGVRCDAAGSLVACSSFSGEDATACEGKLVTATGTGPDRRSAELAALSACRDEMERTRRTEQWPTRVDAPCAIERCAGDGAEGSADFSGGLRISGPGSIDRSSVLQALRRAAGSFKSCYERLLKSDPKLEGRVIIVFVLDPNMPSGQPRSVRASADDALRSLADCIVRQVQRVSFPLPEGGKVTVSFPIVFKQAR